MRRLSFLILLSALCLGTPSAQAQNVDEVLDRYHKKIGGEKKINKVKSTKTSAKMFMQGMEVPVVVLQKRPNKQRVDMELQGQKFSQAYNGTEGWMVNPFIQVTEPKKLTDDELKELEDQVSFDNPLIDYKKKGHTVALEGTETIDGSEYHKVKLTKKNGNVHYYLFHKENSIPVVVRRVILGGPMKGQTGETHLGDFKAAGNILLPHTVVNKFQGQTIMEFKIDSYEVDAEIDDAVFEFPTK